MSEQNKAVVRRLIEEAVSKGNMSVVDETIAGDYIYHSPGSPELRGPEGIKELINGYRSAFPDMQMIVDDMVAEGDKVATRWTARGTHKGDLQGIAPTGKQVTVSGLVLSRFSGSKIAEEWELFDTMGMMQQLGVVPAQASA